MRVAVLGLGEAGSLLAADLARSGDEVHGYDPARPPDVDGVQRHETGPAAVTGCTLVLAATPGSQAGVVLERVAPHLQEGAIYADLSTGSPSLKHQLSEVAAGAGVSFADVALMSAVPGRGLSTPALASGSGAVDYARLINARGGNVEVVGVKAGEAAARKLLRSVVMKGLAALLIESTEAAARYGQADWFWNHLVDQLSSIDEVWMERLLFATGSHAGRRLEEMEAARDLLTELGVPATMTGAVIDQYRRLLEHGMPWCSGS
jgi:3-hydroxyisobutyrate dehydrogenase-like beta-hydroxyacid dehydrogenase